MTAHDHGFSSSLRFEHSLLKAAAFSRDPNRLLGVVELAHIRSTDVIRDDQVWRRIGIGLSGFSQLNVARHVVELSNSEEAV